MVGVAQVVAAGHAYPALASDEAAQGEGTGDDQPQDRGVEHRVDGEAEVDGC